MAKKPDLLPIPQKLDEHLLVYLNENFRRVADIIGAVEEYIAHTHSHDTELTGVSVDDHHAQVHTHSHDTEITGISADDHHAQSHTHASHTGVGANDHHAQAHGDSDHTDATRKRGYVSVWDKSTSDPNWPDGATHWMKYFFYVPDDYVSGSITIRIMRRSNAVSSNTAVMRYSGYRFRSNTAFHQWANLVSANMVGTAVLSGESELLTITLSSSDFLVGDLIRVDLERLGADGSDNFTGAIGFDGAWIEYLAAA